MGETIRKEMVFPQRRERVWGAIASSDALAEWMFPNDFEARVGHRFTFKVPGNPAVKFEGLTVECEVLACEPPARLVFSWTAGGLGETRVSFRLQAEGEGTRLFLEHSGFEMTEAFGKQAFRGAEYGWARMLGQLGAVVAKGGAGEVGVS
jgi:uncharacterized protein YndB with AHSA1/START domain